MRVLLLISGGIAAYKTPDLVRRLRDRGHEVQCALTPAATRLVASDALAAVSGHPAHGNLWPGDGSMPHIALARWAEAALVAPATADLLARISLGLADDLPTTLALALDPKLPRFLAPAMNTVMWNQPQVQEHITRLRNFGWRVIDPVAGNLSCGEQGLGAMADPADIAAKIA